MYVLKLAGLFVLSVLLGAGAYFAGQQTVNHSEGAALSVLTVPQGGSGNSTFPVGDCIKGNGTAPFTSGSCGSGGGGAAFPFTPDSNYAALTNATGTPVWFKAGLQASSTSQIAYASSTAISAANFYGALIGNASTATAFAANGTNCSAGTSHLGVDASGAVEGCFDVWTEAENTAAAYLASVTVDAPLTGAGTSASHLSIPAATGAVNGYLSAANFVTFFANRLGTSTVLTQGQALYAGAGGNTAASVATGTLAGTANQIAVSATAYTLLNGATLSFPQSLIFPLSFTSTYGTTTFASSTALTATNLFGTNGIITNATTTAHYNSGISSTSILIANNATTTTLAITGVSAGCLQALSSGAIISTGSSCGAGGGSSGGTWATTTSQVPGQFINYPLNDTDIVAIGANSTTTAEFWFDPNTITATFGKGGAGDSTLAFGPNTNNQWLVGWRDSDKNFVIASSTALSSTVALAISKTSLISTFGGGIVVNGASSTVTGNLQIATSSQSTSLLPFYTMAFSYGSTTQGTGTTTRYLAPAPAGLTFKSAQCDFSNFMGISLYDGTNRADYFIASSTIGTITYTANNNTFTTGKAIRVDIGTSTNIAAAVSGGCRFKYTII